MATKKANKTRAETTTKTARVPVLIPRPNGRGALNSGGTPGNRGGIGAPPSELRQRLVGSFAERVAVIEQIADGRPIKRAELALATVLRYAHCPKCGDALKVNPDVAAADILTVTLEAEESASPGDRLKALDLAAKYGLGVKDEITVVHPEVQTRVERMIALILQRPTWETEALLQTLSEVWHD